MQKGETQQQFDINQYALLTWCFKFAIGHIKQRSRRSCKRETGWVRARGRGTSRHIHRSLAQTTLMTFVFCRRSRHSHNLIKKFFMCPPQSPSPSLSCCLFSLSLSILFSHINGRRFYCGFPAFCLPVMKVTLTFRSASLRFFAFLSLLLSPSLKNFNKFL